MNSHHALIPPAEWLSALVDGELHTAECPAALGSPASSSEVALQWRTYHLIGDALRADSGQLRADQFGADAQFVTRLSQRLALETISPVAVVAVVAVAADPAQVVNAVPLPPIQADVRVDGAVKQAANDGNGRWKMLAGVACMGTVAALAWSLAGVNPNSGADQLALTGQGGAQGQVVVTSAQGPVVRDARLEELLAAHKQMGGTSLPVPTGFLRNANFENLTSGKR